MANFHLYKYEFKKLTEVTKSLFSTSAEKPLSHEVLSTMLDEQFQMTLKNSSTQALNLYAFQTNRKGVSTSEMYVNKILHNEDGITLMEVRNNKTKKIMPTSGNEETPVDHHPICWVIIDTRPESSAILIQQKNATFSSTQVVLELIVSYCNQTFRLSELGWEMAIEQRMCKGQIWDVVNTRISGGRDRVKSLCLKFDGKREAIAANPVDVALQMILDKLASPDGELKLNAGDPTKKLLDETMPDVKNTVDMLIENHYHIKVYFDKSGSYEHGKDAPAIYGLDDVHCEDFAVQNKQIITEDSRQGYELVFWLDKLMPEDNSHEYTVTKRKKRNGGKK